MKSYLVMGVHGSNPALFHEAAYAIWSFFRWNLPATAGYRVLFYTDQPEQIQPLLGDLPIQFCPITTQTVAEWKGEANFVHRFKIRMLKDAAERTGPAALLYTDADVVFNGPVDELFQRIAGGGLVLHTPEGALHTDPKPLPRKLHRFLRRHPQMGVSPSAVMWNAGVIGFHTDRAALIGEVLQLSDRLYAAYPKHVMEQLAFSHCFQQAGPVSPAEQLIFHYWSYKEFRKVLGAFFRLYPQWPGPDAVPSLLDSIYPERLLQVKEGFEARPYLYRLLAKLKGHSWEQDVAALLPAPIASLLSDTRR